MARADRQPRHGWTTFVEIQTRWEDNDAYGHVNNTVYYSWFDTVVNSWLIRNGLLDIAGSDVISLVVETGCTYFESVAFPEPIDVGLRVDRLGTSSVVYGLGVFRRDAPMTAALGRFVHVTVDRATQRPVPMPDEMRLKLLTLATVPT